tara:strand:+ start:2373 stop:2867 length:495 start_codon:yes stop_codon:yes gene_type:complete
MKFYETMYIVHPILEMGRLHDLILEVDKNLSENNCEVVYTKLMGKKRMAYPIQKQKFGTYVVVQYKGDGTYNNKLTFDMKNNPNILRHMIINIDESDVEESIEDIKDQISGLTRVSSSPEKEEVVEDKSEVEKSKPDESQEGKREGVEKETSKEDTETNEEKEG